MDNYLIVLMLMIFTSTIAGWSFSRYKQAEIPIKVMIFMLYFWLFVFIQLIIFAIMYQFGMLDFL